MNEVEIRDLETSEVEIVANFFHDQWRTNHVFYRNRKLLFWQYHDNPYGKLFSKGLTFRAAFDRDGPPLGVFGYMPFVFNRYGGRQYGCHLSAWWVHPDQRRGPLALRLLHSLQEQSPFNACIAGINSPTAERIYERMSWVVVRNIPRLVYVVDGKQFWKLLDSTMPAPEQALSAIQSSSTLRESRSAISLFEVSSLQSFDSLSDLGWDNFFWQNIAPALIGPAREASYLQWRYGRVPGFQYEALKVTRDGAITGLLVYRVERVRDREEQVIRLVDLIAEPQAVVPLVQGLLRSALDLRVALIDFFCTYAPYLDQLRAFGFVDASDSTGEQYWLPHLFQPLDHTRNRLNCSWWIREMDLRTSLARADFCLMKGDYEFDRPN